jgi:hypothetical protein
MPRQLACNARVAVLMLRTISDIMMRSATVAPVVPATLRTLLASAASLKVVDAVL